MLNQHLRASAFVRAHMPTHAYRDFEEHQMTQVCETTVKDSCGIPFSCPHPLISSVSFLSSLYEEQLHLSLTAMNIQKIWQQPNGLRVWKAMIVKDALLIKYIAFRKSYLHVRVIKWRTVRSFVYQCPRSGKIIQHCLGEWFKEHVTFALQYPASVSWITGEWILFVSQAVHRKSFQQRLNLLHYLFGGKSYTVGEVDETGEENS